MTQSSFEPSDYTDEAKLDHFVPALTKSGLGQERFDALHIAQLESIKELEKRTSDNFLMLYHEEENERKAEGYMSQLQSKRRVLHHYQQLLLAAKEVCLLPVKVPGDGNCGVWSILLQMDCLDVFLGQVYDDGESLAKFHHNDFLFFVLHACGDLVVGVGFR